MVHWVAKCEFGNEVIVGVQVPRHSTSAVCGSAGAAALMVRVCVLFVGTRFLITPFSECFTELKTRLKIKKYKVNHLLTLRVCVIYDRQNIYIVLYIYIFSQICDPMATSNHASTFDKLVGNAENMRNAVCAVSRTQRFFLLALSLPTLPPIRALTLIVVP